MMQYGVKSVYLSLKKVDVKRRIKRKYRTQWYRNNFDADIGVECYKNCVLILFLDHYST